MFAILCLQETFEKVEEHRADCECFAALLLWLWLNFCENQFWIWQFSDMCPLKPPVLSWSLWFIYCKRKGICTLSFLLWGCFAAVFIDRLDSLSWFLFWKTIWRWFELADIAVCNPVFSVRARFSVAKWWWWSVHNCLLLLSNATFKAWPHWDTCSFVWTAVAVQHLS